MSEFTTGLSDAERERLALLSEECAEVIQVIGKIFRHGFESTHPNGGPNNRQLLAHEIGDMQLATQLCIDAKDFDNEEMLQSLERKVLSVQKYLHFQPQFSLPQEEVQRLRQLDKTSCCAALRSCLEAHGATQCLSLMDKLGCGK